MASTAPARRLKSLSELHDWLASQGIGTASWGTGNAKTPHDLWSEIVKGETVLTENPPERHVSAVAVIIRRGGKTLTETGQTLRSGTARRRDIPPTEKMLPGETVEAAAIRCVGEELGMAVTEADIVPGSRTVTEKIRVSQSFPGLATRYTVHEIEIRDPGLPDESFTTVECQDGTDGVTRDHRWEWR